MNQIKLVRAIRRMDDIAHRGEKPTPDDAITRLKPLGRFDSSKARSRILALWLAQHQPRTAYGKAFAAAKALANLGKDAVPMIVRTQDLRERKLARNAENRIVLRPEHLSDFRSKLASNSLSEAILAGHLIPAEAAAAYAAGDHDEFLRLRRQHLRAREAELVTSLGLSYENADSGDAG